MNRKIFPLLLLATLLAGPALAKKNSIAWRDYKVPGHGTFSVQVPAAWKQDVRQPADPSLPPTIVLQPKKGDAFELLMTPIPAQGDQPPTPEMLDAGLAQGGEKHLAGAVEETLAIESLEGERAFGRYFQLTEKEPPPDEYPSVLSGVLVTGPVVTSFTLLHRDRNGEHVRQVLALLASARFETAAAGSYRAAMSDLQIKVLMAAAAGLEPEFLVEKPKELRMKLGPFLLDAETVRGGIRIHLDGSEPGEAQELLEMLTIGFPPLH